MPSATRPKPINPATPGLSRPIVGVDSVWRAEAWLDTDKPRSVPIYHLVAKRRGDDQEYDFLSMTANQVRALAESLLQVHAQMTASTSAPSDAA